jgi:hypothetical protein
MGKKSVTKVLILGAYGLVVKLATTPGLEVCRSLGVHGTS